VNILISCNHTGLGNLFMFLHAVRLRKFDGETIQWFHNSRHFPDEPIEFAQPHRDEKIDLVFILYPNITVARRVKSNCPVLGFQYRIKGVHVPFFLSRSLRWDNRMPEIINNLRLLDLWQEYYSRSAAIPATN